MQVACCDQTDIVKIAQVQAKVQAAKVAANNAVEDLNDETAESVAQAAEYVEEKAADLKTGANGRK